MKARAGWALALTLAISPACEIVRPVDEIEAHPDVVALAILLVAGESEARLLTIHPHRERYAGDPEVRATLKGPGWSADFSNTLALRACGALGGGWHVPTKCLGAELPEAIRSGSTYHIKGTAPLGDFIGQAMVPEQPVLLEPAHQKWLELPEDPGLIDIPVEYAIGEDMGTLLVDLLDVYETMEDGIEVRIPVSNLGPFPTTVQGLKADTIQIYQDLRPLRFSLRLFGVGWNYTNFVEHTGIDPLPRPWPSFGIVGQKGVYGYFDGVAASPSVGISVGNVANPNRTH